MDITIVGLGYIGLPTSALFARGGHNVYGYDINPAMRETLRRGEVSIAELPVKEAVQDALQSGRLHIVDNIPKSKAYILCLPTPTRDGKPDLSYVENAAGKVAAVADPGSILVLESTVPPGTTDRIFEKALAQAGKSVDDFHIAHCPERVIPGSIMEELRSNARVVGGRTPEDANLVRDIYRSFCEGEIAITTSAVAEFVKVVENTYRDVNIAFANELAILGEELNIDVWDTISLANKHPRVNILSPGPGVGGHCIPVDPYFLSDANPFVTELIQSARRINERMPHRIVRRITDRLGVGHGKKIAILGAAYKGDVDDARETPTARVDALLSERGFETAIYDPLVTQFSRPLCATLEEAVEGADGLVLITPHTAFRAIDPAAMAPLVRTRFLVDTRRFFDEREWKRAGFECYVLGRAFQVPVTA